MQTFLSIIQTRGAQELESYTAFVDFRKAYDLIPKEHLWYKLFKLGLSGNILVALKSLYTNVKCSVCTANGLTASFAITGGLKQGGVISPLLFSTYLNDFVTELKEGEDGISANMM